MDPPQPLLRQEQEPPPPQRQRQRIVVPQRMVQGGFDFKFETDSYDVKLHGMLSPQEYTDVVERLNQSIKPARSNSLDGALLVAGPLLVPLALWGVRHSWQTRKRKRLLQQAIHEFNTEGHPELLMRWNRSGPQSKLTIERREQTNTDNGGEGTATTNINRSAITVPPSDLLPPLPQQQQQQQQYPQSTPPPHPHAAMVVPSQQQQYQQYNVSAEDGLAIAEAKLLNNIC